MPPLVSIILPVFNSSPYLKESIDSLLSQTHTNLEILIINDGSTDDSASIINTFTDSRIKYHQNEKNEGLVYTLNKGIALAQGTYIARMDADDICLPNRIALQVDFMENHPAYAMVAGLITFIDEHKNNTGIWPLDQQTITNQSIKHALLKENCIAHPTVLFRADKIKRYQYNSLNKHCEDYGLWLDLLINNQQIGKVNEVVLWYRVHTESITGSINKKKNPFFINAKVKASLLINCLKKIKWGWWQTALLFFLCRDILLGCGKTIKGLLTHYLSKA